MVKAQILEISGFFPSLLCFFFLSLGVSPVFYYSCSLFLSTLLLVILSSPSFHLVVGGVRCQETREIDLEPRVKAHLKARGYFLSCTQREGEKVSKWEEGE